MEIHPPHGRIESFKQFLLHMGTVTLGILIAFSLEGAREWHENRHLVREARANLQSEMRDNQKELDDSLRKLVKSEEAFNKYLDVIDKLNERDRSADPQAKKMHFDLALSYSMAELTAASRTTAETTGAFGHMDYAEVKRLAQVYDLQQQFLRLQDRTLDHAGAAMGEARRLEKMTPEQREAMRQGIDLTLSEINVLKAIGGALSRAYRDALAGK